MEGHDEEIYGRNRQTKEMTVDREQEEQEEEEEEEWDN